MRAEGLARSRRGGHRLHPNVEITPAAGSGHVRLSRKSWAIVAAVLVLVAALAAFGVIRPSSGVATTSRSMSHADENLPGIIDPGETVSYAGATRRADVVTMLEGRRVGHAVAGDFGDVVAYNAQGETGVQGILHRAIAWIEYDPMTDAYDVPALGLQDVREFVVPDVGSWDPFRGAYVHEPLHVVLDPAFAGRHDGFLTKGDHNGAADQDARGRLGDLGRVELVEPRHVTGKVVSWVDGEESLSIFWWAFGVAALVALGFALFGKRLRARLGASVGRCGACGARVDAEHGFCPRCGESPRA